MHFEYKNLGEELRQAVKAFWGTRQEQQRMQARRGQADQGARGAVTGGRQMDGIVSLITNVMRRAGLEDENIFKSSRLELPGYFRAEKKWDILAVKDGQLIAAIEAKSQVGPSFGNNLNNRCEEAIGSAVDLWTAYREGAVNAKGPKPWVGYFFLLEDCAASTRPVVVKEPHFKVLPVFEKASYLERYGILCRSLIRERHYSAAAFLSSPRKEGAKGDFREPMTDLTFSAFAKSLAAQVATFSS